MRNRTGIRRIESSRGEVMFGLGYQELLVLFVILLVLFGASRIPKLARALGSSLMEFEAGRKGTGSSAPTDKQPGTRA
jgi:sec-independent protein translocase protein TatA